MNALMTDASGPRKAKDELSKENFDRFLRWLSEDREAAGLEFEKIRRRFTRFFAGKGFLDPDELASMTMIRATNVENFTEYATPLRLCFGVARKIVQEQRRPIQPKPLPEDDFLARPVSDTEERERQSRCLDACLAKLPENSRKLIIDYYQYNKREKIAARRRLAIEHGGEERLRVKAFRIREKLRACMAACLEQ